MGNKFDRIYDSSGLLVQINVDIDDISYPLPFDFKTKTFEENDPLVIELRQWEKENGQLDLSDRIPDPLPQSVEYRLNKLLPSDRFVECDRFPGDINYSTDLIIGLTTKTIDYFGLRVAQLLYQSLDTDSFEPLDTPIPIVCEQYEYVWDEALKVPTSRVKKIRFYLEDNTLSQEFKILPKEFYSASDRTDITSKRRQTIMFWLIARATELGLGQPVKDYFAKYKDLTDRYCLYGDTTILQNVTDSTESWLEINTPTPMGTVRQAILLCFKKALEATPKAEINAFLQSQIQ